MRRQGFSRIELLIVIGILGIATALVFAAAQKVREAAARAATHNNMRQIGIVVHSLNIDWKAIPPGYGLFIKMGKTGSVFFHLLPYIESRPDWDMDRHDGFFAVFQAQSDPTSTIKTGPVTSFGANANVFSNGDKNLEEAMPDGLANVILFATIAQNCPNPSNWGAATGRHLVTATPEPKFRVTDSSNCNPDGFSGFGSLGISVGMGDTVVKVVSPKQAKSGWAFGMLPADKKNPDFD